MRPPSPNWRADPKSNRALRPRSAAELPQKRKRLLVCGYSLKLHIIAEKVHGLCGARPDPVGNSGPGRRTRWGPRREWRKPRGAEAPERGGLAEESGGARRSAAKRIGVEERKGTRREGKRGEGKRGKGRKRSRGCKVQVRRSAVLSYVQLFNFHCKGIYIKMDK
ncbi:LAMI_0F16204g1_1 [Lachancea mirantina]|uniref:LAMI_0F16204g1_1 n=1 Tax=Lachancea mirantina TaxID=1230905 RepID=A0A1G4K4U2_9SACH|nr:LAMI_0F16204g1_1 [Lachancea mirantina]